MTKNRVAAAHPADEAGLAALRRTCAAHGARALQLDHDLRTPLGTLAAALDLLGTASQDDPGLRGETLRVMERQLERLRGIAEGLHALGRELQAAGEDAGGGAGATCPSPSGGASRPAA
jgi:signal transduction histidine kinase